MVWTHATVWGAIDALASRHGLTVSGLARKAGLDPTAFNRSKRCSADGRPRWPSTESIAKILTATGASLEEFVGLVETRTRYGGRAADVRLPAPAQVPLLGLAQAGAGGFFDDGGFPVGQGWDEIDLPVADSEGSYALEVSGDSMLPLYRNGDVIIVSPTSQLRPGDRVVVKTTEGEVMAKTLQRQTTDAVELHSLNPEHPDRVVPLTEIEWIARIIWASQ
ncbi:helix-turn-helix transcriptional regulator [Afifella sp. JA880]|uniref:S24 family peptidase n=1 Tax=Afifella sp. JA880 TaxID=2975280 RepID=UPI0021BB9157|nr:helix-turn-helix transcriptional regulator [Afifella sp. JA880]MCT8269054.1 helix-turn-helix transcriptional regulator [Afifella sp. JA880]